MMAGSCGMLEAMQGSGRKGWLMWAVMAYAGTAWLVWCGMQPRGGAQPTRCVAGKPVAPSPIRSWTVQV